MTKLSIIILNYNTKDLTIKCLESIENQYGEHLRSEEIEVIVVDNASTDGSAEDIKNFQFSIFNFQSNSKTKNFQLIKNEENVGFSRGNNVGAKEARGEYLFFLNSDTEVLNHELLEMVDYLDKNEDVGILGARLKNPDGSNQKSAGKFYNLFNVFLMLLGAERLGMLRFCPNRISNVDWVSGAALMIKADLFKNLNGFDEKLFMYMEDMELCFRAKKAGYKIFFYPEVNIIHEELGSSNRTFAIINIYKNLLYFYKKHKSFPEYLIVKFLLCTKAILLILIGVVTRKDYLVMTYKKAIKV